MLPRNYIYIAERLFIALAFCLAMMPWTTSTATAAEITIHEASTELAENVYRLNATIDYQFSTAALEALQRGVPLVFELNIDIERSRDYLWNESVASLLQRYQLRYIALTSRYVVTNLNSGAELQYPSREMAIAEMGQIMGLPLLDAGLVNDDEEYTIMLRARLDIESLPVPMRVTAYFSSDWRIKSEWYTWPLR